MSAKVLRADDTEGRALAALSAIFDMIGRAPTYGGQVCLSPAEVSLWLAKHAGPITAALKAYPVKPTEPNPPNTTPYPSKVGSGEGESL